MEIANNGWLIGENPIKMDDLGVSLFRETSISPSNRFHPAARSRENGDGVSANVHNTHHRLSAALDTQPGRHVHILYGGFLNWGYPKMAGLYGKIPPKWMIWGYPISGNLHMVQSIPIYASEHICNIVSSLIYVQLRWTT